MVDRAAREAFEAQITGFGNLVPGSVADFVEQAAEGAKANDLDAAGRLAAALARVGFATPEATTLVYDAFTRGWLGIGTEDLATPPAQAASADLLREPAELPMQFRVPFWSVVEDAATGISAGDITSRVAALLGTLPPGFQARAEAVARAHPGAAEAAVRPQPPRLSLATLATQPEGSLGHDFYRLITDNKFDLEVLDREAIGLGRLPPALAYLNTRILQMHDIWHLVGGYQTTALHEVAISSFQLGQFGHNYSAMFLAVVTASSRFAFPPGLPVLLQVMAEAWRHSRTSPSFMAIPWEAEWHQPLGSVRAKFGIAPFQSLIPADLVERSRGQAA
jgi:ubiquinone biosynthesis protein Coq4